MPLGNPKAAAHVAVRPSVLVTNNNNNNNNNNKLLLGVQCLKLTRYTQCVYLVKAVCNEIYALP